MTVAKANLRFFKETGKGPCARLIIHHGSNPKSRLTDVKIKKKDAIAIIKLLNKQIEESSDNN